MASFNHVTLVGNITRDIEVRYLQDGTAVCDIGLAVNDSYKTQNGDKREDVLFIDCTCWKKTAEVAGEYLAKGRQVLLSGRLKQENWTDKDGNKRSKIKMVVERLVMLGSKNGNQGDDHQESRQEQPRQQSASRPAEQPEVPADSDIPF